MSNLEVEPSEVACGASPTAAVSEVLRPREVPLGGPRAIRVQRTLPQRQRSLIGAWCFIDHYGPAATQMDVPPHPHTGLQTVSWLFDGEVEHRDSAGVHAMVHPGELNLMTAGAGICHSEVSTPGRVLRGAQLWVALPDSARDTGRAFAHYRPEETLLPSARLKVFLGELAGSRSPVTPFTPLLGAQVDLDPGAGVDLSVDPAFEHGVLCDAGPVQMGGVTLAVAELGYQGPGHQTLHLRSAGGAPARVLLLGGVPFGEQLVMWWNFVGRSHDDIVAYRQSWQDGNDGPAADRFGAVAGYRGPVTRLPAPPLPTTRLLPRPAAQPEERT
ncbi:pirin family protein [Mycobacterium vicinigordonae]|uniref:Pirin family protein n=1 Tax=Mycobacterium vicinigordonae TaxID=1719132 RepID=A0A7D6HU51_9MYCO|nr:pirin family protein [Mycobacterium vicinigordonae]QLL07492.1 pirin family protein [Mycobacterium vicinigordonae]